MSLPASAKSPAQPVLVLVSHRPVGAAQCAALIAPYGGVFERGFGSARPIAQAVDENIDEPQDALLPTRLVVHVAHAHKGTKQVLRADVVANFPGRDRSVQQPADGPRQPIE